MIPATFHPSVTHSKANPRRSKTRRAPSSVTVTRAVSQGRQDDLAGEVRLCHAVLRVDAMAAEKITEPFDLIAQGREGGPLVQASGLAVDQALFPIAEHRGVLEVLGVDGAFLVATDLGNLPIELGQVRSGTDALLQHRQAPGHRVELIAKLGQLPALPPAAGAAGSRLLADLPGGHQADHFLADPVR